jgi:hypothetical protein
MVIQIDAKKVFNKIQNAFRIRALGEFGIERIYINK